MPISPSPAVLRACDVLQHLTRHPDATFNVSELARLVGLPRATCDSVLLALAEHGFVVRNDDDLRYALGSACIAVGDAARAANSVLAAAANEAEQLARSTSSCAAVSTRDGGETRVVDVFDFGPMFGIRTRVGQSIPLVPPFGAVFVAWDDDDGVRGWLEHPDVSLSTAERHRYRSALAAVRRRGYSVTVATTRRPEFVATLEKLVSSPGADDARRKRDELIREMTHSEYLSTDIGADVVARVSQMSAPVFDRDGEVVAAIMVLGSDYDITGSEISDLGDHLLAAAARATTRAGGNRPNTSSSHIDKQREKL